MSCSYVPCAYAVLKICDLFFCVAGDVGSVYFGPNHPMKPHRLCMTHHLILAYGLHSKMEVYVRLSHLSCLFILYSFCLESHCSSCLYSLASTQGIPYRDGPVPFSRLCRVPATNQPRK